MKRILLKFLTLAILLTAGILFQTSTTVEAAANLSCWEKAFNQFMTCDNAYYNTRNNFGTANSRINYCNGQPSHQCSAIANSYCTSQANSSCAQYIDNASGTNNSNYQACYNQSYSSCYMSRYQFCAQQDFLKCMSDAEKSYDARGSDFAHCLSGPEGNASICVEQMEHCPNAQQRASECYSQYGSSEDSEARNTCLNNSGIWQCQ